MSEICGRCSFVQLINQFYREKNVYLLNCQKRETIFYVFFTRPLFLFVIFYSCRFFQLKRKYIRNVIDNDGNEIFVMRILLKTCKFSWCQKIVLSYGWHKIKLWKVLARKKIPWNVFHHSRRSVCEWVRKGERWRGVWLNVVFLSACMRCIAPPRQWTFYSKTFYLHGKTVEIFIHCLSK